GSLRRDRVRRSRRPPWSMMLTSGSSMVNKPSGGIAAATSSPPRPRRCAASSSRTPAASGPSGTAAGSSGSGLAPPGIAAPTPSEDHLALDEALTKLEAEDPVKARLVKLRYFAGLTEEDAASALGISRTTAQRHWRYAKVWLLKELRAATGAEEKW